MLTQEHKIWAHQRRLFEHIELLGELGFRSSTAVELMRDLVATPPRGRVRLVNKKLSQDTEVLPPIVARCLGCGQRISKTKRVCRACWDDLQRRIEEEKASINIDKAEPVNDCAEELVLNPPQSAASTPSQPA